MIDEHLFYKELIEYAELIDSGLDNGLDISEIDKTDFGLTYKRTSKSNENGT